MYLGTYLHNISMAKDITVLTLDSMMVPNRLLLLLSFLLFDV